MGMHRPTLRCELDESVSHNVALDVMPVIVAHRCLAKARSLRHVHRNAVRQGSASSRGPEPPSLWREIDHAHSPYTIDDKCDEGAPAIRDSL